MAKKKTPALSPGTGQRFSIISVVGRKQGDPPLTEAKMTQLLRQFFKDWEHGQIVIYDVIESKPKE